MHGTSGLSWKKATDSTGNQVSLTFSHTRVLALFFSFLLFFQKEAAVLVVGLKEATAEIAMPGKNQKYIAVVTDLAVS